MVANIFDQSANNVTQAGNVQNTIAAGGVPQQSMNSYINPWQQQVIGNTVGRMNDQFQQQYDQVGDAALAAGAFGGSRHGLVESQITDDYMRNMGETVGGMNAQGFNTAANLGMQAVNQQLGASQALGNTANQQFNMGQVLNQNQAAQGQQQQNLAQMVLDMANTDAAGYQAHPTSSVANILNALGGSPLQGNSTTTSTMKPGLFDYLGLGGQVMGGSMGGKLLGGK